MAKFKITYSSGVEEEVEQSDCHTVEQMINCRFGTIDLTDLGVSVVLLDAASEGLAVPDIGQTANLTGDETAGESTDEISDVASSGDGGAGE